MRQQYPKLKPWGTLPKGRWVFLKVPVGTTEADVIALFSNRTGVEIDAEAIRFKSTQRLTTWLCVISLSDEAISGVLNWALQDDKLGEITPVFECGRMGQISTRIQECFQG